MALNQLMHPRNRYKDVRPDFKMLAEKYSEFKEHTTTDSKGRVHVEFRDPASLRALTWALLKNDFDIDISIPLDRLIPTVPLRLNYILWLEDIFSSAAQQELLGIDIGTGASCVYPLLGAKLNDWRFTATDADATNVDYALANVAQNNLSDKIKVVHVSKDTTLLDVVQDADSQYDFCMCNPPFYGSNLEAWGWLTTRKDAEKPRAEPTSVSTASPIEGIAPGGEVQFVRERIIESSVELQSRVRVYTTMLGKKSSVSTLKETLHMKGITNIGTTEFCQGKTMRWGLAWTFEPNITFPKPISKVLKAHKSKPPLCHSLPDKFTSVVAVAVIVESIFDELQVSHSRTFWSDSEAGDHSWRIECRSNTWSHQRRRRREMMLAERRSRQTDTSDSVMADDSISVSQTTPSPHNTSCDSPPPTKRTRLDPTSLGTGDENSTLAHQDEIMASVHASSGDSTPNPDRTKVNPSSLSSEGQSITNSVSSEVVVPATCVHDRRSREDSSRAAKRLGLDPSSLGTEGKDGSPQDKNSSSYSTTVKVDSNISSTDSSGDDVIMVCDVTVRKADLHVKLEMSWVDGQNRELMHQLLQFFKNRLV